MKNLELYKLLAMRLVAPESRHIIQNVFDKWEEDKIGSTCEGLNNVLMFMKHENQMVAGASFTSFVLGILLTLSCEEKVMVEILESYLDVSSTKAENIIDFAKIRKDKGYGTSH